MAKNYLLDYSEELATKCEILCRSIRGNANAVNQLRRSSSSVFANISEAQFPQSLPDMLSKFKIARKECVESESWLKLLWNTGLIDEDTFKTYRNLCGRIELGNKGFADLCLTAWLCRHQAWIYYTRNAPLCQGGIRNYFCLCADGFCV